RPDGPRAGRGARSLRPLDRRPRLAHTRRHRGRSQAAAPPPHGAGRRLRVRAPAGLMRRLYLRIYLAVLASLIVFAVAAAIVWRLLGDASGAAVDTAAVPPENVRGQADAAP